MELALLLTRIVLAAVLATAGSAKLINIPGTRKTLEDFGVPASWRAALAITLPIAELIVAAGLLIPGSAAWIATLAAFLLFLIFTAGMSYNFALGRTPECNCFGALRPSRVGLRSLIRTALLAATAFALLIAFKSNLAFHLTRPSRFALGSFLMMLTGFAVLVRLFVEMSRQNDHLTERLDELEDFLSSGTLQASGARQPLLQNNHLPIGAPAPDFILTNLNGKTEQLKDLFNEPRPLVLFFLSSDCAPCAALIPEIDLWRRELASRYNVAIISRGSVESNREKFGKVVDVPRPADGSLLIYRNVLIDENGLVAGDYRAKWTPAAMILTADRAIGSAVAFGSEQIKELLDRVVDADDDEPWLTEVGETQEPSSLRIGDAAPPFSSLDTNGKTIDLDVLKGRRTLILFWGPACHFCDELLPDLERWDRERLEHQPQLLIVSRGAIEKPMQLKAPVILDPDQIISRAYGSAGTPSAILVDANGRIASAVGAGASEVLALAGFVRERNANHLSESV